MNKKRKINIAIVGLGNIGSFLYKHLILNKKSIKKQTNVDFEIKYVSFKNRFKKRKIKFPKKKILKNYLLASKLPDIDIVVELIGGSEGAAKLMPWTSVLDTRWLQKVTN